MTGWLQVITARLGCEFTITLSLFQGDYESCQMVSKKVLEEDPYHLSALPVARPAWLRPCRSSDITKLNGQERISRDVFNHIFIRRSFISSTGHMIVFDFNHAIERKPVLRFISPPWWCSTWPTNLAWCACWRMQRDGPILLSWSLTWQWSPSPSFTFKNTGDPAKSLEFNSLACMDMGVRHSLSTFQYLISTSQVTLSQTICKMLSA